MIIEAGHRILVLRFNNYKEWNFIEEHRKLLKKHNYVWILKAGKPINISTMKNIIDEGGHLILKEPKNDGGRFYYMHILEFNNGMPQKEYIYPEYYKNMLENEECYILESLEGTWLKIDVVCEINHQVEHLKLISNGKRLDETLLKTRSSLLYVNTAEDIEI